MQRGAVEIGLDAMAGPGGMQDRVAAGVDDVEEAAPAVAAITVLDLGGGPLDGVVVGNGDGGAGGGEGAVVGVVALASGDREDSPPPGLVEQV
jgi:hypothetical protein